MIINTVVEGSSDLGLAQALLVASGHKMGSGYPKSGKSRLDPAIPRYALAARYGDRAWLILRDWDGECPVHLRTLLSGHSTTEQEPDNFVFSIVHTMSEGWFLGDPDGVAAYFSVPRTRIPAAPEKLGDPKRFLLQLKLPALPHSTPEALRPPGYLSCPGVHDNDE